MELNQCINFLLSVAQNTVFRQLSARLSPYGITPAQYGVLNCLWNETGSSPKQIAEKLRLEASSVSSVLDRMQKSGLIDRTIDPEDRRNIQVVATERGMELKEPIQRIIVEVNEEVLVSFSKEEQEKLRKDLLAIADIKFK